MNASASKKSILKSTVEKSRQYLPFTLNRWREIFFSVTSNKINAGKQGTVRVIEIICITEKGKKS